MIRNRKILGLAGVVVLAIAALAVSVAWAEAPEFHVGEAPATIKGEQIGSNTLTLQGGSVKCTTGTLEAAMSGTTSSSLEFSATYEGCKYAGVAATWHMNGCKYSDTLVIGSVPPTTVTDLKCPAGKEVTITTTPGCVVHIPPQEGVKHTIWDKEGAGANADLKATVTETGIKYTETSGCFFPGTYSNGVYNATETHKAVKGGGVQVPLTVE